MKMKTKKIIALVIVIMFRHRGIMGSREFALCDIPRWPAKLRGVAYRPLRGQIRTEGGQAPCLKQQKSRCWRPCIWAFPSEGCTLCRILTSPSIPASWWP